MKKLGRPIETLEELVDNLKQVETYIHGDNEYLSNEMCDYISRGSCFVAYYYKNEMHFAPSRFVGYLNNKLEIHRVKNNGKDGTKTNDAISAILANRCKPNDLYEKSYISYCKSLDITPKDMVRATRKYWLLKKEQQFDLLEGGVQQITMNRYERNPAARKRCIEKYGTTCKVCGLSFKDMYGEIGNGFIHVHHITPLSQTKVVHSIDETDLIPVCPNCHAMLHKGNVSVEELRKIVKRK